MISIYNRPAKQMNYLSNRGNTPEPFVFIDHDEYLPRIAECQEFLQFPITWDVSGVTNMSLTQCAKLVIDKIGLVLHYDCGGLPVLYEFTPVVLNVFGMVISKQMVCNCQYSLCMVIDDDDGHFLPKSMDDVREFIMNNWKDEDGSYNEITFLFLTEVGCVWSGEYILDKLLGMDLPSPDVQPDLTIRENVIPIGVNNQLTHLITMKFSDI